PASPWPPSPAPLRVRGMTQVVAPFELGSKTLTDPYFLRKRGECNHRVTHLDGPAIHTSLSAGSANNELACALKVTITLFTVTKLHIVLYYTQGCGMQERSVHRKSHLLLHLRH